jgi:hypothetical protein
MHEFGAGGRHFGRIIQKTDSWECYRRKMSSEFVFRACCTESARRLNTSTILATVGSTVLFSRNACQWLPPWPTRCAQTANSPVCQRIGEVLEVFTIYWMLLEDPTHEQHKELRDWVGGDYDPEAFSNRILTRLVPRRSSAAVTASLSTEHFSVDLSLGLVVKTSSGQASDIANSCSALIACNYRSVAERTSRRPCLLPKGIGDAS